MNYSDEYKILSLDYEMMVEFASKIIKQNDEDITISMIYETQVPKISYDVDQAVKELRISKTGGAIIN